MKKVKLLLSLLLMTNVFMTSVFAESRNEQVLKERLLSYGMYSEITDNVNNNEKSVDLSNLTYKEIHDKVELEVIEKISQFAEGNILWDPAFVLELAPQEYPELSEVLREQLYQQGYNPAENVIGSITIESNKMTRATSYTKKLSYSYTATGHGMVLSCDNTITWSMDGKNFSISGLKAEFTGGWGGIDKSTSVRNNNTTTGYGFYSYTAYKDAYSYSAYVQLKVTPSSNGTATISLLSQGVNSIGIGYSESLD
ncbi:MAG: hypothetical protein RR623_05985 [Bacilli bacterium]